MGTGDPICPDCRMFLPMHAEKCLQGSIFGMVPTDAGTNYLPGVTTNTSILPNGYNFITDYGTTMNYDPQNWTRDQLQQALAQYLGDSVFANRFADCMEMLRRKNADYSKGVQAVDRVAGFRDIANEQGLKMTQVWGVFFLKHMQAIRKFIRGGTLESEPIDGRINDAINYLVLLGAIINDGGE